MTSSDAIGIASRLRCGRGSSLSSFLRRELLLRLLCGSSVELQPMRNDSPPGKSEKLVDLLHRAEARERREIEGETRRKAGALERLKEVVMHLQGEGEEGESLKREAAGRVRSLSKEEPEARNLLAMLGAIPPLIGMIDSSVDDNGDAKINALYALLNLGIGNDANKSAIVQAGAVHKMLKLIEAEPADNEGKNSLVCEAIVANLLGLSASDLNKPVIGSSGAIPFLVKTLVDLDNKSSAQAKQDAMRALFNLSILPSNVSLILETGLIPFLINSLGNMDISERILSILSNIVSTSEGRKAISTLQDAFTVLVDVLSWTDSPNCQENAAYILMVMAHKGYGDRQAMVDAGIVSALLELTLLGSTLAQKRASRILECLWVDKGKQASENYAGRSFPVVSAPISSNTSTSATQHGGTKECLEEEYMMSEEKKAVKQLVQQSLQNNMKRIVKRANLPQEFIPSDHHLKAFAASSTSKSLPF